MGEVVDEVVDEVVGEAVDEAGFKSEIGGIGSATVIVIWVGGSKGSQSVLVIHVSE